MIQHTPGPFTVKRLGDGSCSYRIGNIVGTAGQKICAFPGRAAASRFTGPVYEGNASLLALAPFAPHECGDVTCPGVRVLAVLQKVAGGYASAHDMSEARAILETLATRGNSEP